MLGQQKPHRRTAEGETGGQRPVGRLQQDRQLPCDREPEPRLDRPQRGRIRTGKFGEPHTGAEGRDGRSH